MEKNLIEIYIHPNPEVRSFLMPREIFPPRVEIFTLPLSSDARRRLEGLSEIPGRIVKDLLSVSGVREIHVKPKEIRVKKSRTADWDGMQQEILGIVLRSVKRSEIRLVP